MKEGREVWAGVVWRFRGRNEAERKVEVGSEGERWEGRVEDEDTGDGVRYMGNGEERLEDSESDEGVKDKEDEGNDKEEGVKLEEDVEEKEEEEEEDEERENWEKGGKLAAEAIGTEYDCDARVCDGTGLTVLNWYGFNKRFCWKRRCWVNNCCCCCCWSEEKVSLLISCGK